MPQNNQLPELRNYMGKKVSVRLNGKRYVEGSLMGFDPFMNLTLDNAQEVVSGNQRNPMGVVVIRGNSVEMVECLEQVNYRK
ncbi:hypothetical protein ABK040_002926 [Willaertia magna]